MTVLAEVTIPPEGWEKPGWRDDGSDPHMIGPLIHAIAPLPGWVYEMFDRAGEVGATVLRISPHEHYRLQHAVGPLSTLLGLRLVVATDVPDGVVRLTA